MECPSNDICREKRKNRKLSFEKAVKWIAVSIAVIAGIKMTDRRGACGRLLCRYWQIRRITWRVDIYIAESGLITENG